MTSLMMASKRRLNYSPSGATPSTKSHRRSGLQSKNIQATLQDQIQQYMRADSRGRVWLGEIQQRVRLNPETDTDRSIIYAVKALFSNVKYKRGVFNGVAFIPTNPDVDDDMRPLQAAPTPVTTPEVVTNVSLGEDYIEPESPKSPLRNASPHGSVSGATSTPTVCNCVSNTIRLINDEFFELAKHGNPSILRCPDTELDELNINDFITEFETRTPVLYRILKEGVQNKRESRSQLSKSKEVALITVLCKLANIHNQNLNAYQKLYGLTLRTSGLTKRCINKTSQLYDSVAYSTLTNILDKYAEESREMLKTWENFTIIQCGDNLDIRTSKRHESGGSSHHEVHMYNNLLYKSRIDVEHLSTAVPQVDLEDIDYGQFLLSPIEESKLLEHMLFHIETSWQDISGIKLNPVKPAVKYPSESKEKTEKLHIGVLCKSEQKTSEMLQILEHCQKFPSPDHPHQPKVPYRGDVGTYKVAKKALSIADPATGLSFIPCIGAFHLQMEWVQTIFDVFFDETGGRDPEGLSAMKVILNAKQVVPNNIRKNYYAADLFLEKVLDALLLEAASASIGPNAISQPQLVDAEDGKMSALKTLEDVLQYEKTCARVLPSDRCPVCDRKYVNHKTLKKHIIDKHPDAFILEGEGAGLGDSVVAHTHQLLKVLLLKRCLDHAIKSADGEFLTNIMKHMMIYFHRFGYHNYALACFEHVAQCQIFLSEQATELVQQECFVNNRGRAMTNMPMDLDLEHNNKFFKEHFTLRSNEPSQPVIRRLSLAQNKLQQVLDQFHSEFQIYRHTALRHMDPEKYKEDVLKLHQHLSLRHIFQAEPGRTMYSNKLMIAGHDPRLTMDMYEFKQWVHNSLKKMGDQLFYE